jgi:hypothetical protein
LYQADHQHGRRLNENTKAHICVFKRSRPLGVVVLTRNYMGVPFRIITVAVIDKVRIGDN